MLTRLEAYSAWDDAPTLPLSDNGREETDLIQIRNITGLDPVKAAVNTSPFGSVDGAAYIGSSVPTRNIVLTIRPNPDWNDWTYESLRRLLYLYFMPKQLARLVFYSNDMPPVEIYGYVEDVSVTNFAKDVEIQVSIICPDPYFTAVNATVVLGEATGQTTPAIPVQYNGTVSTGLNLEVRELTHGAIAIGIVIDGLNMWSFATLNAWTYFVLNSLPGKKYIQNVDMNSGVITNLLSSVGAGSVWPVLKPGVNQVIVNSDAGTQDFKITYFERFGGL